MSVSVYGNTWDCLSIVDGGNFRMPQSIVFLVLVPEIFFNLHCSLLMIFFVFRNGFANKNATIPNFGLMNQASLDKILKAEVFIHTDSHLRVAHLILDYFPISKSFQAPKCIIKARDPRL